MLRKRPVDPAREELRRYYANAPIAKGGREEAKAEAREERQESERERRVRIYVFARERDICRCCRLRTAVSRHELRFRSLGGKVTRENCVAVCGDGVQGCHGHLQANRIGYRFEVPDRGAESTIYFPVKDEQAAEWLKVAVGTEIVSQPMVETEIAAL